MLVEPGQGVSREDVIAAYQIFLERLPESEAAITSQMRHPTWDSLTNALMSAPGFARRMTIAGKPDFVASRHQVYRGYELRELELFKRFKPYNGDGSPGFVTNFLGVKISTAFSRPLAAYDGKVEGYPIPTGGVQAETAEYIGVLRSVLGARDRFTMIECGAGFGTWMVNSAVAARQCNIKDIRLYGIEGDAGHIDFMSRHLLNNGIDAAACNITHGAVGAEAGLAFWAVTENPEQVYGGRPIENGEIDYLGAKQEQRVEIKVHAIADLLRNEAEWDLLHMDIQGGEGEVCRAGIAVMDERVRRVVLGTHSRALDGELMTIFYNAGWSLENEKPTISIWRDGAQTLESTTRVDGIQVWRNPRLARAETA